MVGEISKAKESFGGATADADSGGGGVGGDDGYRQFARQTVALAST